jgi:hypothetical protein
MMELMAIPIIMAIMEIIVETTLQIMGIISTVRALVAVLELGMVDTPLEVIM